MTDYDVAIVGGGPAGAAAALTAQRHGLNACVVDKAEFPRNKTCGDGLTTNALRQLEALGIPFCALEAKPGVASVTDVVLVGPNHRVVQTPLPSRDGRYAVVIAREHLDNVLIEAVAAAGVETRLGAGLDSIEVTHDGAQLTLANGSTLRARHVIAADGHWSTTRRLLEPERSTDLGEWHAVRQYFATAGDQRLWVLFERDLLPGYFWVFPMPDGRANVGFGVLRSQARSGKQLKALWTDLLQRPHIQRILGPQAVPLDTVRAWPIPTRYEPALLNDRCVLYVGDAAKVVDPMTGEGIAQALETGVLAADAIARGGDVAATYRSQVHHHLGRDLVFAGALQRVLTHPIGTRAALRTVDLNAWTRRNFARWMFEDYPRAILGTPDRWRGNPFGRSGAYVNG